MLCVQIICHLLKCTCACKCQFSNFHTYLPGKTVVYECAEYSTIFASVKQQKCYKKQPLGLLLLCLTEESERGKS